MQNSFNPSSRNSLPAGGLSKDSLNKYKKKRPNPSIANNYSKSSSEKTSKNQFQKYFLDATNVFYEDRDTLKQLQQIKFQVRVLLPIWFFLAFTYFIMSRIQPFKGECPANATCKVFPRCNPGYQFSEQGTECHIKKSIIDNIQAVCQFEVNHLRLQYGQSDCLADGPHGTPTKKMSQIIYQTTKDLQPTLSGQLSARIREYFSDQANQQLYQFTIAGGYIVPTTKKHSLSCTFKLFTQTKSFIFVCILVVLILIFTVLAIIHIKKQIKAKHIYQYLKDIAVRENIVNVTLESDYINSNFGKMDEDIWAKVEQQRKNEGKIGFYQDQFLYWKVI